MVRMLALWQLLLKVTIQRDMSEEQRIDVSVRCLYRKDGECVLDPCGGIGIISIEAAAYARVSGCTPDGYSIHPDPISSSLSSTTRM